MTSPVPEESVAAAGPAPAVADGGRVKRAARGRYRDALRHRDLRLLIAAFLVDQTGRWWPSLLLASYGGVLAVRYQRTTVMVFSALASAVLMVGLAVVVAADAPVAFVLAISALSSV